MLRCDNVRADMDIRTQIDARIAKLQKAKRLLSNPLLNNPEILALVTKLGPLLSDPEISAMVAKLETNGTAESPDTESPDTEPRRRPHPFLGMRGTLAMTAYECVQRMRGPFSSRELVEKMKGAGYEFMGKEPIVTIQRALKRLQRGKVIRVVAQGSGRRPTVYERKE
jgi:hypothetical protein